jgi:hypothetical protein
VSFPAIATFIGMRLYKGLRFFDLLFGQAMIVRKGYGRLKPELGLPVWAGHQDVHTGLFAGEEETSIRAFAEKR